jgi:hypothetical protein
MRAQTIRECLHPSSGQSRRVLVERLSDPVKKCKGGAGVAAHAAGIYFFMRNVGIGEALENMHPTQREFC